MPAHLRKRTGHRINRKGRRVETTTWQVQIPVGEKTAGGEDPTGSQTRKVAYLFKSFPTKGEAEAFLTDRLAERETGGIVKPSSQLVSAYLTGWLKAARPRLRDNTVASYQRIIDCYLVPQLGQRRLSELTPQMISHAYSELLETPLSSRTVRYCHAVLRRALRSAVKARLLSTNPAAVLVEDLPRGEPTREMHPLTQVEARALLEASRALDGDGKPVHRLGVFFELALVSGCRPSELFALQWKDLDLKGRLVTVKHSLVRTGDTWKLTEPKRKTSRRSVPIPEDTVEALRDWKRRQAEERMEAARAGSPWRGEHKFVFTTLTGQPLEIRNLSLRDLARIAKAAGLAREIPPKTARRKPTYEPEFTLYDLRHSCATLMLAAGVNPKVVSERLGHASAAFTMDVYVHVLPTMQAEATEKYGGMLYG